jgi:cobalamin biosynthesis Co2+ chelatase CbiK
MKIESMVTITGAEYEALRAEVERLTAALEEVRVLVFGANNSDLRYPKARAALKEPRT